MAKQFVVSKRSVGIKCVVNIQLTKFKGQAPYFSVTGEAYRITGRQGRPPMLASGCIHDYIQQVTSRFDDVIALHLSDIDGTPMHAVENGLYWLGQNKYQALDTEAAKRHFRCTDSEIIELLAAYKHGKQAYIDYIDKHLRPRWQQEAQAVIDKYGLEVEAER